MILEVDSDNPDMILILVDEPNVDQVFESADAEQNIIDPRMLEGTLKFCKRVRVISEATFRTLPEFQHNFGIPPKFPNGENNGQ